MNCKLLKALTKKAYHETVQIISLPKETGNPTVSIQCYIARGSGIHTLDRCHHLSNFGVFCNVADVFLHNEYLITLHPSVVIENLLPVDCNWTLVDQTQAACLEVFFVLSFNLKIQGLTKSGASEAVLKLPASQLSIALKIDRIFPLI